MNVKRHHRERHEERPHKCDDDGSEKSYGRKENRDQKDRDCNGVEEYASDLTNESLSTPQNSSMAGLSHKMPFTNPNSSNRPLYHSGVQSQAHNRMPQHHGKQQGPPANLSYDHQDALVSERYTDFQLFNQISYVTEEVEQSLTDPSHSAPEIEALTDDYPSAFYATPVKILPKGFYADYTGSQPAQYEIAPYAKMSIDPGPSSSSQLATFPTSRCHSPSPKRLDAQVSGGISPGQWDYHSVSQERHPPAPKPHSLSRPFILPSYTNVNIDQEDGDNDYLDASTNRDCGHAKIDSRTNDRPQLVRTSIITQKNGRNSNGPHFSPSPVQAILKIVGKLESMAEEWTPQERGNCRRIVLFHKTQKGATVNATCQSVSVNEIPSGSICISCIWWAEKGECYVTSVDIVYLLGQLIVGPKLFDRQERERVRCNLDTFESQTIRKINPDTKKFFNIIMGFSDPKPRNLERDIKLFPWRILGDALKEVFRLYSISPSHTVSALNVNPDQRKFTTPEGQRMLSPPRTSTTPQQACPVTEEVEQSLTDPSHSAPEIEALTDDYPSAFYATPVNILPKGFYADYTGSQPAQYEIAPYAKMSIDPGPSSSSPPEARVSDDLLPEQCLSQAQVSKQPMGELQSRQVSVYESPAQRDVPVDPVLTPDIQLDSNSEEAKTSRERSDGVSEGPSGFPYQARPDPDSNLISLHRESSLHGTSIQDESGPDSAGDTIVVCVRPERECHNNNAPTLSPEEHFDGVNDTNPDTEATYDDWDHTIADGKITIYNKNTLLTNFDRGIQHEVPVRDMCPEVQNILDRIYEKFLQEDIKQQEDEAEAEQIHIKRRIRAITQRNTSCSENTDAQQCHEETHSTIDELQKIMPDLKGLDLSRIPVRELDDILETVQDILHNAIHHIKVVLVFCEK
ncbi:hypothetical protein Forpe1208_v016157 [Fusarium oxysporum f. sp. rapae]|uniref:DUF7082 domain-containing protein n=1 Tax=Fusarium oxysporum f. sp. rapae TaxID=485398 RepID=A0A8J5NGK7_FUSOX|nr:hypothetical protein Forpe1208_v016157 [Fusarium oxysporum f. sp. rapae]